MSQTEILNTIYQMRILSKEQIIKTFFPKDIHNNRGNTYGDKVLRDMIKAEFIEKRKVLGKIYYQTTTKGYSTLKRQDIYFIGNNDTSFDEFKPNCRILLKDKQVTHQEHLNNFPLSLIQKNIPLKWIYRDDMYVSKEFMGLLHPDGVLECGKDCFFLEMDMGTEGPKQLTDKWLRYRRLLTKGNIQTWNSITVLFLQRSTRSIQRRETIIKSIQDTISDLMDGIHFNIRIGSETELFQWFYNEMIRKYITEEPQDIETILTRQGYTVSKAKTLSTGRTNPTYYVRAKNTDGTIRIINGIADEFLLDENMYQPQSVLLNTMLYEEMSLEIFSQTQRKMRYVILEDTEGESSEKLKEESGAREGVLFTTKKRLVEKQGSERFYKIINGIKYHYNENYSRLVVESE